MMLRGTEREKAQQFQKLELSVMYNPHYGGDIRSVSAFFQYCVEELNEAEKDPLQQNYFDFVESAFDYWVRRLHVVVIR